MADDKSNSFEAQLQQLEAIVRQLEGGEPDLDRAVTLYKQGRQLVAACEAMLTTAQEQLEKTAAPARPLDDPLDDDEVAL